MSLINPKKSDPYKDFDFVIVPCKYKASTDKAYYLTLLIDDEDKDVWVPNSQVKLAANKTTCRMTSWMARKIKLDLSVAIEDEEEYDD